LIFVALLYLLVLQNDRNPILVPELAEDFMKDCAIKIPDNSVYMDSAYTRDKSVDTLLEEWETAIEAGDENADERICAVIGPFALGANEGTSVLTEHFHIPQLAYATIDRRLSREDDFPTFRRVIPRGEDFARTVAEYVQRDIRQREYIGILYEDSDFGEGFEEPLEDAEELYGFESITEHLREGDDETIEDALEEVIKKGYRTIVLITKRPAILDDIARFADKMGMLNGDYFWIISGDAFPPALEPHLKYEVDSATDKLLRGAALFTNYDRFVYEGESNAFLQEWRNQSPSMVVDLNGMMPRKSNGEPYYVADPNAYFQTETPAEYSSFIYDAVMTAGISACKAVKDEENDHLYHVLRTEFTGASGPLSFYDANTEDYETSRNMEGVMFGMYNVRPGPVDDNNLRR
jgi:hypothetical protein